MSTKIYNGYLLNVSFTELMPFLKKVKLSLESARTELALKIVARQVTSEVDDQFLGLTRPQEISIFKFTSALLDSAVKAQKSTSLLDGRDFSASVVLIPHQEKFLALFYDNNNPEYLKLWQELKEVQDYHYQNSTDRPEEISAKEWEKRRKDWNEALPGSGIPSENGLIFQFLDSNTWYDLIDFRKEIFNFVPTFKERINRQVEKTLRTEVEGDFLQKHNLTAFKDYYEWSKFDAYFREEKLKEGFQKKIKATEERIKGALPKEITEEVIKTYNLNVTK